MFYYNNWDDFCSWIKDCGLTTCTAGHSLHIGHNTRFVVLKHDVESDVARAYRLAEIEYSHGICGPYYVQAFLLEKENNVRMLQQMQQWGHEISYHYDVLDAHSGDYVAAEKDFIQKLTKFRNCGFRFTTICQHGNPVKNRTGYTSNRDFFRNEEIRERYPDFVDMVVDYSKHTSHEYKYISDVGYRWNVITLPETNDLHPEVKNLKLNGFKGLRQMISNSRESFIVSTHPHRWNNTCVKAYTRILVFRIVRGTVSVVCHIPGVKRILSQFYYLAKKI